jgi:hypothetical protein
MLPKISVWAHAQRRKQGNVFKPFIKCAKFYIFYNFLHFFAHPSWLQCPNWAVWPFPIEKAREATGQLPVELGRVLAPKLQAAGFPGECSLPTSSEWRWTSVHCTEPPNLMPVCHVLWEKTYSSSSICVSLILLQTISVFWKTTVAS